jgi:hypothetical protein
MNSEELPHLLHKLLHIPDISLDHIRREPVFIEVLVKRCRRLP